MQPHSIFHMFMFFEKTFVFMCRKLTHNNNISLVFNHLKVPSWQNIALKAICARCWKFYAFVYCQAHKISHK